MVDELEQRGRAVRALLCPASLKGVLSARAAAAALARGFREAGAEAIELPVADGGEGTCEALAAALGGEWREAVVSDPLGRPVPARWLVLPDGRAVVEAAAAIGLPLLAPRGARSAARLESGSRRARARRARGVAGVARRRARRHRDRRRRRRAARGACASFPFRRRSLCDVRTRLADAARLFGPQKGASPAGRRRARAAARGDGGARALRRAARRRRGGRSRCGARRARAPSSSRARRRCSTSSASTSASPVATSSSPARGRSTRRRPRERRPARSSPRCAAAGVRCVVFGGRVRSRSRAPRRSRSQAIARAPKPTSSSWRSSAVELMWRRGCGREAAAFRAFATGSARADSGLRMRLARLGGGEAVGHRLEQLPGDLRPRLDERPEDEDRQPVRLEVGERRHGRGARAAVDERDLAERGARARASRPPRREPRPMPRRSRRRRTCSPPSPSSAILSPAREPPLVELVREALEILLVEARRRGGRCEAGLVSAWTWGDSYTNGVPRVTSSGLGRRESSSIRSSAPWSRSTHAL